MALTLRPSFVCSNNIPARTTVVQRQTATMPRQTEQTAISEPPAPASRPIVSAKYLKVIALSLAAKVTVFMVTTCGLFATSQLVAAGLHLHAQSALLSMGLATGLVPGAALVYVVLAARKAWSAWNVEPMQAESALLRAEYQEKDRFRTTVTWAGDGFVQDYFAPSASLLETAPRDTLKAELYFRDAPLKLPEMPWEALARPDERSARPRVAAARADGPMPLTTTELQLDDPWKS